MLRQWRDNEGTAPFKVKRGDAAVVGNMAYFMSYYGETCSYNSTTKKWSKLPRCPCTCIRLAVIRGLLTAIGGYKVLSLYSQNKLLSIIVNNEDRDWVECFPPMPTKRYVTAAVTTEQHLIEVGGKSRLIFKYVNTVEVMDIQNLVWSTAAS